MRTASIPAFFNAPPTTAATSASVERTPILAGACPCLTGLAGAPGPAADVRRSRLQVPFRIEEPPEIALELGPREIARIDPVEPGPARRPGRHQAVALEPAQRLLNAGERRSEEPRQLARVALAQELEREERSGPAVPPKGDDVPTNIYGHLTILHGREQASPRGPRPDESRGPEPSLSAAARQAMAARPLGKTSPLPRHSGEEHAGNRGRRLARESDALGGSEKQSGVNAARVVRKQPRGRSVSYIRRRPPPSSASRRRQAHRRHERDEGAVDVERAALLRADLSLVLVDAV